MKLDFSNIGTQLMSEGGGEVSLSAFFFFLTDEVEVLCFRPTRARARASLVVMQ